LILAVLTSGIALLIGSLAALITVSGVMDFGFSFSLRTAGEALLLATLLVAIFGGYGTWRVLNVRPVPYLRSE
jgi:predicted lysophospholipase L1 biosynthesis ABC-type transport system permease subunit